MKFYSIAGTAVVAMVVTFFAVKLTESKSTGSILIMSNPDLEAELKKVKDQEALDDRLGQYAINMMYRSGAHNRLSKGKMQILARSIVRIANDIFPENEQKRRDFVMVLAIESGFNRFAQSPTGPKGYGQLARAAFHEGMKDCGMGDMHDEDVWETDLNLYAAACYFKKMLISADNDTGLAVISYNQGSNSESVKSYKRNGDMVQLEPLRYLSKITFLTKAVTDQKVPGVPSITELPVPVAPKVNKEKKSKLKEEVIGEIKTETVESPISETKVNKEEKHGNSDSVQEQK